VLACRCPPKLTDFITERRARRPGLHVYHYNHYEPTSVDHLTELHRTRQEAVGALMGRFATREDEVDGLFRLGVFTDLYRSSGIDTLQHFGLSGLLAAVLAVTSAGRRNVGNIGLVVHDQQTGSGS